MFRIRVRYVFACVVVITCFYYIAHYNILVYLKTESFAKFRYPLDLDMKELIKSVRIGEGVNAKAMNYLVEPQILDNDKKCKTEEGIDDSIYLLILVKSRINSFDKRDVIRRTWGRESYYSQWPSVRRGFLLGVNSSDHDVQHQVGLEHAQHGDILQFYFTDSYYNNTLKLMLGLQWASRNCRGADYVMFMDDDYYLSVRNVLHFVGDVGETALRNSIVGYIWTHSMPKRQKASKWYISLAEYPYRFWPPYPTAGSFLIAMSTVQDVVIAMKYVKYLRFDDVFLGIIAMKLNIKLIHHKEVHFYPLAYEKDRYRNVLAAHGWNNPKTLYTAWSEQEELHEKRQQFRDWHAKRF